MNMENYKEDKLSADGLQINEDVRFKFAEAAKWGRFISICMFIFCGLILIGATVGGSVLMAIFQKSGSFSNFGSLSGGLIIGVAAFIVAILAVTYYFLFNFATKLKTSFATENNDTMNNALSSLKVFLIISGVLSALSLLNSIYALFK